MVYENSMNYIISSLFHLIIPIMAFLSAYSKHDNLYVLKRIYEISYKVVPLYLFITLVAYYGFNYIGMGAPVMILTTLCPLDKVFKSFTLKNVLYLLMALASLVFSMKRAVIVSFALCIIGLVILRPKRILALTLLPFILIPFYFSSDISTHFIGRIESISSETKGFTSGQARESEVLSIMNHLKRTDTYLLGSGIGATYNYLDHRGSVHKNYHNSHVSFFGWMLRLGIVGSSLLSLIYLLILVKAIPLIGLKNLSSIYSCLLLFLVVSIIPMSLVSYNLSGNFLQII